MTTPWFSRYDFDLTDAELIRRVTIRADVLKDFGNATPSADADRLRDAMSRIYVPSSGQRAALRRFHETAMAHCATAYPSAKVYKQRLYARDWCDEHPAICLTGPAGVGKSTTLLALDRLLGPAETISLEDLNGVPITPLWHMTLSSGMGLGDLLSPFIENHSERATGQKSGRPSPGTAMKAARWRCYRDGVCLLVLDELQFVTLSAAASARATSLLLMLRSIGVRLVYAANYSMVHRLKARNQEDRQRLLSDPIVLMPDDIDSENWIAFVKEVFFVTPASFDMTAERVQEELHRYTHGIRRLVVELLVLSYRHARATNRKVVKPSDIRAAYSSAAFTTNREDVELMISQDISGSKKREDLWCPFISPAKSNVEVLTSAVKNYDREVERSLLASSLTAKEKKMLNSIEKDTKQPRTAASVVPIRSRPITKERLQRGTDMLFNKEP